jgi:hypothetical protein
MKLPHEAGGAIMVCKCSLLHLGSSNFPKGPLFARTPFRSKGDPGELGESGFQIFDDLGAMMSGAVDWRNLRGIRL